MKRYITLLITMFTAFSIYADDPYQTLANELSKYSEGIKKVAVIPFSYADNVQLTKDGSVIAERLSIKLINLGRFDVIERTQLDKVLQELKLQSSGMIDTQSAKELGKILGVDAIITGTLVTTAEGKIEVNARIIKTDTAQAIGAAQVYVEKDWVGGEAPKKQRALPTYTTPSEYTSKTPGNPTNFFDFVYGFGKSKVDINPDNNLVKEGSGLKAKGINPFGIRFGLYGNSILGGELELSYSKHQIEKQDVFEDKYLDIGVFNMYLDILMRVPENKKFFAYLGFGIGFGLGNISSNYITDSWNKKLDETSFALAFRFPIGFRLNISDFTMFTEYRFGGISMSFDRGYQGESNSLYINNSGPVFGLGFRF